MALRKLCLGVKTDPVEYRYSYEWLFRLMAEEGAPHAQLGSFFELYHLPDAYFHELRQTAADYGVKISSLFTAHRELGGFMRPETGWEGVARRSFERLIDVAALVGADAVGSSPGSLLRDGMAYKDAGIARYLAHMRELMHYAHERGVGWLTMEPMSCLAEPPTLPEEIEALAGELIAYHQQNRDTTAAVGLCLDIAHGYADSQANVVCDNLALIETSLPYTCEVHLKNTDRIFNATFGFSETDRARGIVDVPAIRELILSQGDRLPVSTLIGYLEISGPKTGRDYSDRQLEEQLRQSLRYLRQVWPTEE